MEYQINRHQFSGKGPIIAINCIARFLREARINKMWRALVFVALSTLLKWFANSQFAVKVVLLPPEMEELWASWK